jgi:hypothetical protein
MMPMLQAITLAALMVGAGVFLIVSGIDKRGWPTNGCSKPSAERPPAAGSARRCEPSVRKRVAITPQLKETAESRARELVAAAPPFDTGRGRQGVYVGQDVVVFVFGGDGPGRGLSRLLDERVNRDVGQRPAPLLRSRDSRTRPITRTRRRAP